MTLLQIISGDLNVPESMLREALSSSRKLVKHLKIPKHDGTKRLVYQPSKKLKIIQYWLNSRIFSNLKVHESATAYQKDKSIKLNASSHRNKRYILKLDFKDFFPSIKFNDIVPYLKEWYSCNKPAFEENELLEIVRKSCFYLGDSLPIGYPTSPLISNIVLYKFDSKITASLTDKDKYGSAVYTRYADDLAFSTNISGACRKIKNMITKELRSMSSPSLTLNARKTRYVSSSGGSAVITGLKICHDGHITILRKYKDKIRLLITLHQKGKLTIEETNSLKGHLSHIRNVDSTFYTKLHKKYFNVINELLHPTSEL